VLLIRFKKPLMLLSSLRGDGNLKKSKPDSVTERENHLYCQILSNIVISGKSVADVLKDHKNVDTHKFNQWLKKGNEEPIKNYIF
jgi:hypothetical protein